MRNILAGPELIFSAEEEVESADMREDTCQYSWQRTSEGCVDLSI